MTQGQPQYPPDDWLIELGKLNQTWATLDQLINLMIEKLCSFSNEPFNENFLILITHSSFPQRIDMLTSLCDRLSDEFPHLKPYKSVVGKIRSAAKSRNFFAHSRIHYDADSETASAQVISARGKLKLENQPVDLAKISKARLDTFEAIKGLYRLVLQADPWSES